KAHLGTRCAETLFRLQVDREFHSIGKPGLSRYRRSRAELIAEFCDIEIRGKIEAIHQNAAVQHGCVLGTAESEVRVQHRPHSFGVAKANRLPLERQIELNAWLICDGPA